MKPKKKFCTRKSAIECRNHMLAARLAHIFLPQSTVCSIVEVGRGTYSTVYGFIVLFQKRGKKGRRAVGSPPRKMEQAAIWAGMYCTVHCTTTALTVYMYRRGAKWASASSQRISMAKKRDCCVWTKHYIPEREEKTLSHRARRDKRLTKPPRPYLIQSILSYCSTGSTVVQRDVTTHAVCGGVSRRLTSMYM